MSTSKRKSDSNPVIGYVNGVPLRTREEPDSDESTDDTMDEGAALLADLEAEGT